MKELSLNILDIVQNSIEAGAKTVTITVNEDEKGYFMFSVLDDGKGMTEDMIKKIKDPFVTTRTTRKVGLGIPLVDMASQQSGGELIITSKVGKGTFLKATFLKDNIDRPPLGNIVETIKVILVGNPKLHLIMHYLVNREEFIFDTDEMKKILGPEINYSMPEIYSWLNDFLSQEIQKVREAGGVQ